MDPKVELKEPDGQQEEPVRLASLVRHAATRWGWVALALAVGIGWFRGPGSAIKFLGCWAVLEALRLRYEHGLLERGARTHFASFLLTLTAWCLPLFLSYQFEDWFSEVFTTANERQQEAVQAAHREVRFARPFKSLREPWWLHDYPRLLEAAGRRSDGRLTMDVQDPQFGHLTIRFTACVTPEATVESDTMDTTLFNAPTSSLRVVREGEGVHLYTDANCDGLFDCAGAVSSLDDEGEALVMDSGIVVHRLNVTPILDDDAHRETYDSIERAVGYLVNLEVYQVANRWEPYHPIGARLASLWWIWAPLLLLGALYYVARRLAPSVS